MEEEITSRIIKGFHYKDYSIYKDTAELHGAAHHHPSPAKTFARKSRTIGKSQSHHPTAMEHQNWSCPKCNNPSFEESQFGATGGAFSKFFNIQNKKFTTVTCTRCKFTELYQTDTSTLGNVLDFFGN